MPDDNWRDSTGKSSNPTSGTVGRRSVLKSALGVGGSATLAGCFGDGDGSGSPTVSSTGTALTDNAGLTDSADPSDTRSPTQVTPSGPSDNVTIVPPGGDIQEALDDVAGRGSYGSTPWGVVKLQAGGTYEVSETIEIPGYSSLEFNGAKMVPTGNFDVIDASASSHLGRPYIDVGNGFDSTIIKVTTRVKKVESFDPVYIDRMYLDGRNGKGTAVKCIDNNAEGMWAVQMSGTILGNDVGLHLRAEGEDSWVNSCFYTGIIKGASTGFLTERVDGAIDCTAHELDVVFQPSDSDWFWDLRQGKGITVEAATWDSHEVEEGTFWRIGKGAGFNNKFIDTMGSGTWEEDVVENKIGGAPNGAAGNTYFTHSEAMNHLEMKGTLSDLVGRVDDLAARVEELENN